jgi:hypothetical protein
MHPSGEVHMRAMKRLVLGLVMDSIDLQSNRIFAYGLLIYG